MNTRQLNGSRHEETTVEALLRECSPKQETDSGGLNQSGDLGRTTKCEITTSDSLGWNGEKITAKNLRKMLEQQDYKCALTGRDLTPRVAALDHIIPLSDGGSHTMENVWIVHSEANVAKSTMGLQAFIALCREVAKRSGM